MARIQQKSLVLTVGKVSVKEVSVAVIVMGLSIGTDYVSRMRREQRNSEE